jgi:hypothetical protein
VINESPVFLQSLHTCEEGFEIRELVCEVVQPNVNLLERLCIKEPQKKLVE